MDELWRAIDDGNGIVTRDEFMDGLCKLDGYATAVDAMSIKSMLREIKTKVSKVCRNTGPGNQPTSRSTTGTTHRSTQAGSRSTTVTTNADSNTRANHRGSAA